MSRTAGRLSRTWSRIPKWVKYTGGGLTGLAGLGGLAYGGRHLYKRYGKSRIVAPSSPKSFGASKVI